MSSQKYFKDLILAAKKSKAMGDNDMTPFIIIGITSDAPQSYWTILDTIYKKDRNNNSDNSNIINIINSIEKND